MFVVDVAAEKMENLKEASSITYSSSEQHKYCLSHVFPYTRGHPKSHN